MDRIQYQLKGSGTISATQYNYGVRLPKNVKYYDQDGDDINDPLFYEITCAKCRHRVHQHAILSKDDNSQIVCVGQWIIEDKDGNGDSVMSENDFEEKYEIFKS